MTEKQNLPEELDARHIIALVVAAAEVHCHMPFVAVNAVYDKEAKCVVVTLTPNASADLKLVYIAKDDHWSFSGSCNFKSVAAAWRFFSCVDPDQFPGDLESFFNGFMTFVQEGYGLAEV